MKPERRYRLLLVNERAKGNVQGPLGIPGWKGCKKTTMKDLYHSNKVGVAQALLVLGKLTRGDHSKRINACRSMDEIQKCIADLSANGINAMHIG